MNSEPYKEIVHPKIVNTFKSSQTCMAFKLFQEEILKTYFSMQLQWIRTEASLKETKKLIE